MSKRAAGRQLTDRDRDDDDDEEEEEEEVNKPQPVADESVLQSRKIIKAKRRQPGDGSAPSQNAFAGFGGFGVKPPAVTNPLLASRLGTSSAVKPMDTATTSAAASSSSASQGDAFSALNKSFSEWVQNSIKGSAVVDLSEGLQSYISYAQRIRSGAKAPSSTTTASATTAAPPATTSATAPSFSAPAAKPAGASPFSATAAATSDAKPAETAAPAKPVFAFGSGGPTFGSANKDKDVKPAGDSATAPVFQFGSKPSAPTTTTTTTAPAASTTDTPAAASKPAFSFTAPPAFGAAKPATTAAPASSPSSSFTTEAAKSDKPAIPTFGSSTPAAAAAPFSFGVPKPKDDAAAASAPASTTSAAGAAGSAAPAPAPFAGFGGLSKGVSPFAGLSANSPFATTTPFSLPSVKKPAEEDDDEGGDDDGDDAQPEEEEEEKAPPPVDEAIFSIRGKLFYKKDNDWVERGVGMFMLQAEGDRTKLVMRNESTSRLFLLNVFPYKGMKFVPQGKPGNMNGILFSCVPNPPVSKDNPTAPASFLLRVKTEEQANELRQLLEKHVPKE